MNTILTKYYFNVRTNKTYLYNSRWYKGFNNILEEAKNIAEDINCDPSFPLLNNFRPEKIFVKKDCLTIREG